VEANVEPTVTPPIFVLAEDYYRYPLIFVAGTLDDLDAYFVEHAESEPEGDIRIASRFFDMTGRRWSYEAGDGSGGGLVPTNEIMSAEYLRDIVARGYGELMRACIESEDFATTAAYLANQYGSNLPTDPNYGNERHRDWHRENGIPYNASH
jgi:hypothetical protein